MKKHLFAGVVATLMALQAHAATTSNPIDVKDGCPLDAPEAVDLNWQLDPPDPLAWAMADPSKASAVVTWWCVTKYGGQAQAWAGYKRVLPAETSLVLAQNTRSPPDLKKKALAGVMLCTRSNPESCTQPAVLQQQAQQMVETDAPKYPIWKVRGTGPQPTKRVVSRVRQDADAPETVWAGTSCRCSGVVFEEPGATYCSVEGAENAATPAQDKIPASRVAACEVHQ